MKTTIDQKKASQAHRLVAQLLNSCNQRIISYLREEPANVTEIWTGLRIFEYSFICQHLAILKRLKILKTAREGKYIFYYLNGSKIKSINAAVRNLT